MSSPRRRTLSGVEMAALGVASERSRIVGTRVKAERHRRHAHSSRPSGTQRRRARGLRRRAYVEQVCP